MMVILGNDNSSLQGIFVEGGLVTEIFSVSQAAVTQGTRAWDIHSPRVTRAIDHYAGPLDLDVDAIVMTPQIQARMSTVANSNPGYNTGAITNVRRVVTNGLVFYALDAANAPNQTNVNNYFTLEFHIPDIVDNATVGGDIFPADRCTWTQEIGPDGRGYAITNAAFWSGDGSSQIIQNPKLGYIGKSGRFVEIAN